jgi:hypothetical protein
MIKAWVCILYYASMGGSYSPTVTAVDNLASVSDCHRVGRSWEKASQMVGSYRCVEVVKAK